MSSEHSAITPEKMISVSRLSKVYYLYSRPEDRLKQFVYPRVKRLLGRPVVNYFREFWALKDVSFEVRRGETVGIIGRNGSGKSTLLQLIAGTLNPTAGSVQTYGRVAALLELGAGFNPEFTGRENIYFNAAILGMSPKEIDEHIEDIIAFADIGEFIDQPVKTYSSGMFVRVAFSTAINVNPDILIVDEALAVGDTAFQQKCLHRIRQMQEQGVSILLVTHSNNILLEYCDRGIFLKHGQVMFDGETKDAVRAYGLDVLKDEGANVNLANLRSANQGTNTKQEGVAYRDEQLNAPASGAHMEIVSVDFRNIDGDSQNIFQQKEKFFVDVDFIVRYPIPLPCFGIQVTSTDGIELWTTTTKLMGIDIPPLLPGKYQIRWLLVANLNSNRYVVNIGIGHIEDGNYIRIDSFPFAGHFDVISPTIMGIGWIAFEPTFLLPSAT
ncbi:MAG: ABC transporter ATP-binding protein [Anaerolineales bacterium]